MEAIISLAQTHIYFGELSKNIDNGFRLIEKAIQLKSRLIIFPELWSSGYDYDHMMQTAETNSELLKQLKQIAVQKNIAIAGTYIIRENEKYYNRMIILSPHNESSLFYNKQNLFPLLEETKFFTPGSDGTCGITPLGTTCLAICYDLRFPEFFRRQLHRQYSSILLSAEWPLSRITHWQTLLQARAIENQSWVTAVNCIGNTGGYTYGGNSMIIDPMGTLVASASSDTEELLTCRLDLNAVSEIRHRFPFLPKESCALL